MISTYNSPTDLNAQLVIKKEDIFAKFRASCGQTYLNCSSPLNKLELWDVENGNYKEKMIAGATS